MLVAPTAGGVISHPAVPAELCGALVSFCLMSSATYLVNDVRDRESDRFHPRKRLRPVASGELSPRRALNAAGVMALAALALALLVRRDLAIVLAGYALLTLSYTLWWREIPVLDVLAVAGGFVLRAVAGGAATAVSLSDSFLVVTLACATFLVTGKRYAELTSAGRRTASRAALRHYSGRGLRLALAGSAAIGCAAYAHWSFARPALGPWPALSLLPFGLWLARYAVLINGGAGEAPEDLLLGDRLLLALSLAWILLFLAGVYGSS